MIAHDSDSIRDATEFAFDKTRSITDRVHGTVGSRAPAPRLQASGGVLWERPQTSRDHARQERHAPARHK